MRRKTIWLIAAVVLMALSCGQNESAERELRSEADLSGLTLSTSAGNYYDDKYSLREDITMFRVNSEADGIQALRQGIADVHVTDEVAFTPQMRRDLGIKLAFRSEESFEVAFALKKGNDRLREEMDRFIEQSKVNGSLDSILAHWLEDAPAPTMPMGEPAKDAAPLRCITGINMAPSAMWEKGVPGWGWMPISSSGSPHGAAAVSK